MNKLLQKEIASLQAKLESLKAKEKLEHAQRQSLQKAHDQLIKAVKDAGITVDQYISLFMGDFKRSFNKLVREHAKAKEEAKPQPKTTKKKRRGRTAKSKAASSIKIPAGVYGNIPSAPGQKFEVKAKGPRPKLVKAYAEEVGIETFMKKCKVK